MVVVVACEDEAGVVVFVVGRVKLGSKLVAVEELDPEENPKPVKEVVVAAKEEAAPGVEVVELMVKPVKAGVDEAEVAGVETDAVTATAGLELLGVVENNNDEEVPNNGLETEAEAEAVDPVAEAEAGARLLNEKELWVVKDVEEDGVNENPVDAEEGAVDTVGVAEVVVLRIDEVPKENPVDDAVDENDAAEFAVNKVDPNGEDATEVEDPNKGDENGEEVAAVGGAVVVVVVAGVDDNPNKGLVVVAEEDPNRFEPEKGEEVGVANSDGAAEFAAAPVAGVENGVAKSDGGAEFAAAPVAGVEDGVAKSDGAAEFAAAPVAGVEEGVEKSDGAAELAAAPVAGVEAGVEDPNPKPKEGAEGAAEEEPKPREGTEKAAEDAPKPKEEAVAEEAKLNAGAGEGEEIAAAPVTKEGAAEEEEEREKEKGEETELRLRIHDA